MRFLGHTEVATFLRQYPWQADVVLAWLTEVKHRTWQTAEALRGDFRSADTGDLPLVVFRFGPAELIIETLVDFRNGVVLLTGIWAAAGPEKTSEMNAE